MISAPKKQLLRTASLFSISLFALLTAFNQPALAQPEQSYPKITLDNEVRLQGGDINNGDLGTTGGNNAGVLAAELKSKLTYAVNPDALIFWEGRGVAAAGHSGFEDENTGAIANSGGFVEWRQSYVQLSDIGGVLPANARIGRQMVAEPYGLWWNQNFDAVRANYDTSLFKGSLIGGQNLFHYRTNYNDNSLDNQKDIARVMAEGSWQYYYQNFIEARVAYAGDNQNLCR